MRTVVLAALSAPLPYDLRETVRDWTAAGLVTATLWVDVEGLDGASHDVAALEVTPGRPLRTASLQEELARSGTRQVRLVSVQVVGDPAAQVPVRALQQLQGVMAAGGVDVVRLNVLLRTDASRTTRPAPIVLSTPNVVVQPTDGLSSASPSVTVDASSPTFVAHCAGALATVAGLWAGQDASPYDSDAAWVGDQAEMVRWYRRAVDGSEVWDGLRTSLVTADRLPVPVDTGGQPLEVAPAQAVPAILGSALDSLLASAAALTGEARLQPFVSPPRAKVGFGQALSEFMAFAGSSLRNAPARWLRTAQHELGSAVADRATAALYGTGGGVEVVVNGVVPRRGDGGEDIGALTQVVANVATDLSQQVAVPPPTREFADAFSHTATALLDGAERRDLPVVLPRRGTAAVVVGSPAAVVPDPAAPPFVVRADLGLPSDDAVVTSWSPYSALRVEAQLRAAEEQEVRSGGRNAALLAGIQDARAGLDRWVGAQDSLSWRLLLTLARRLDQSRVQLTDVIAQARASQEVAGPSEELRRKEQVERNMVRLTLLLLPVVVAAVVLLVLFVPLTWALVASAVLVVGWMALLVSRYLVLQSIAWQMIHQRDEARARRAWAEQQVLRATYDVFRLGVAYGCASAWSRVIGAVLHRPFGHDDAVGTPPPPGPVDTPLEMRSAAGRFDRGAMAEVVNRVQRQVLGTGWLGEELRRRVGDVAELRRREAGWDQRQEIFDDPGIDRARELQAAALLVDDPRVQARARSEFEGRVDAAVARFQAERGGDWALQTIRIADDGPVAAGETAAAFLAPVLRVDPGTRLPEIGFSDAGTMDRAATIDDSPLVVTTGSRGSSLPGVAGAPGGGGTPFDRTAVRLDRGRRTHPSQLGVGPEPTAPAGVPDDRWSSAAVPAPRHVEPDF